MPRRKSKGDDQVLEPTAMLMLPAPRIPKHGKEHEQDPYKTLVGAVPGHVSNEKIVGEKPISRDLTADEKQQQMALRVDAAEKGARYNAWLDALIQHGGDKIAALCTVYSIEQGEARIRQYELEAHVKEGMGATDVGEALDRNNLGIAAQARVLGYWAFSENPAAAINAIKVAQEMRGDTNEVGSFESFLRLSKLQGKAS